MERPAFTLKWVGEGSEEMVDTEDLDMMEMEVDYFLRLDPLKKLDVYPLLSPPARDGRVRPGER